MRGRDSRNLTNVFQSTFNTTLVRPSGDGYIALSNMPEASSVPDSPSAGMTEVTFEKSVPMVSYLAIFVVCDFEFLESNTPEKNIPFRSAEVYRALSYKSLRFYRSEVSYGRP